MTITVTNLYREPACNAAVDTLDVGSGTATVIIETAGGDPIATLDLENPAFGSASASGSATAEGLPLSAISTPGGTAAIYRCLNRDGAEVWRGTCGTSGPASMILASLIIPVGGEVRIVSWTHSFPTTP